jgi:hypothetical protein
VKLCTVQYLYGTILYFHKETRIGSESKYSIIQDNNRWKGLEMENIKRKKTFGEDCRRRLSV